MSVQIWVGEIPEHSQEREAIVALARGLARLDELYLILANFTVGGQAVDLAIFKHDAGCVIELKHCDGRVVGGVNGRWEVIGANGEVHTINPDRRNPYNQVISYFYRLSNFLNQNRGEFLSPHRATEVDFRTCKRLVVIAPYVHPESEIVLDWKVDLKGLDELPTYLVTTTSSGIDLTEEELLAIPQLLRCEPWRDINLLVGEEADLPVVEPAKEEEEAERPAVEEAPPSPFPWQRWLLRAGIGLAALIVLAGVLWGTGAWRTLWPPATPTPQPTVTATTIVLQTIPPLPPATDKPLIETVEQPVRRESAFAGGWVTVVLRTVEFSPDQITLRWALFNEGTRPVRLPLNGENITIKDNVGNLYQADETLSEPRVLLAQPGERVEGACVVPRSVSPDALTLRVWVNGEPFEGRAVWPVNVTGRD
jgi:hypothetical protein